jgi:glycolate oxidase
VETTFITFASVQDAVAAVSRLAARGHRPRTLELLDTVALAAMYEHAPRLGGARAHAALIVELDGVGDLTAELSEVVEVANGTEAFVAQDEVQRREIWGARRRVSETLKKMGTHKLSEDIAVPRGQLATLIARITAIAERHHLRHAAYGHAGDGNLHANFFWSDDAQRPAVDAALGETFQAAVALGGTISGEHGVGLLKREFVSLEQSPGAISLQRAVKRVFDPQGILNPHKMFPSERDAAFFLNGGQL